MASDARILSAFKSSFYWPEGLKIECEKLRLEGRNTCHAGLFYNLICSQWFVVGTWFIGIQKKRRKGWGQTRYRVEREKVNSAGLRKLSRFKSPIWVFLEHSKFHIFLEKWRLFAEWGTTKKSELYGLQDKRLEQANWHMFRRDNGNGTLAGQTNEHWNLTCTWRNGGEHFLNSILHIAGGGRGRIVFDMKTIRAKLLFNIFL